MNLWKGQENFTCKLAIKEIVPITAYKKTKLFSTSIGSSNQILEPMLKTIQQLEAIMKEDHT